MGGSPLPGFSFLSKDRVKEHFTTDWTHPPGPDWGQELGLPQAGGAGLDFPGGSPAGSGSPLRSSKCSGCCCRPTLTGVEEGAAAEQLCSAQARESSYGGGAGETSVCGGEIVSVHSLNTVFNNFLFSL